MATVEWTHQKGDSYLVTGVDVYGKRFRRVCPTWGMAQSINVLRGTRWLVRKGKRRRLQTVYN